MTRINLIHPSELCDKHLMACYRELIRIPNAVYKGKMQTYYPDAPKVYTLGAGHVKFFVNKLQFLHKRHQELYNELLYREFNVTEITWSEDMINFFKSKQLYNDYTPTQDEINLNISRIIDRMPIKPKFTHRAEPMYYCFSGVWCNEYI